MNLEPLRELERKWRVVADSLELIAPCRSEIIQARKLRECADDLSRAIAQLDDGWRPIAEAPKDGTPVLLFLPGKEASWAASQCTAYWHEQNDCWCLLETGAHALDGDVWPQPTHFRPLPSPPAQEDAT